MLEVLIEARGWAGIPLETLAHRAAAATLRHLDIPVEESNISLMACDDDRIEVLNASFREKPVPTNVLSWPSDTLAAGEAGQRPRAPVPDFDGTYELGDIAMAYETCAREAEELGKSLEDHATHLIVHGILHLLGYDHIRDRDAVLMQALEVEILGKLGLDDPYRI
ncbi:rRNA maturation RNase YbeY [Roseobacter sinensis]|uniref:Endoribonuclease YbeY n=1 Tax=Roseobacter sinensis TaxID=2931391 RepID=A0ABT3BA86_9RHOB|nr:rRNA maturation RNase YbeY [Roseobacter sp. WL0113]MCV3270486.1 rRNA maturation RNase YbeY [Roseobacter sp. WL0113]